MGGSRKMHDQNASRNFRISLTKRLITSCSHRANVGGPERVKILSIPTWVLVSPLTSPFLPLIFSGHRFGPNSCALHLRAFCFRLLPTNLLKPHRRFLAPLPKCSRSSWEQQPLAFGCPRKTGAEKAYVFMSYLYQFSSDHRFHRQRPGATPTSSESHGCGPTRQAMRT